MQKIIVAIFDTHKDSRKGTYDSLPVYLAGVQRAWNAQDGALLASLVTLQGRHVSSPCLQLEMPDNMVERMLDQPIDEIVCNHLKVLYYLTCSRKLFIST